MKEKRIRLVVYIELIILLLFFVSVFTRVRVSYDKEYHTKNQVAAYLYKYNTLPSNYITKAQRYDGFMEDGKYIGGDIHEYYGAITSYTDNTNLRECDISYTDNTRGAKRLVYALNDKGEVIEIFYTYTHYGMNGDPAFTRVSMFSINLFNNLCSITLVIVITFNSVILIVKRKDEDLIMDNVIIALRNIFGKKK